MQVEYVKVGPHFELTSVSLYMFFSEMVQDMDNNGILNYTSGLFISLLHKRSNDTMQISQLVCSIH